MKKLITMALATMLAMSMAACSGDSKPQTVTTAPTGHENIVVTVEGIELSHTDYFYAEAFTLTAKYDTAAKLYYTLDGSSPESSDSRKLYENGIEFKSSTKDIKSYTIKLCLEKADGTYSDVLTHSYFVGEKIDERFDTLIFSVSTDPYNLYDYEYGIFVPGKLRDDYIAQNPGVKIEAPAPANFNMRGRESERPIYLEVFEANGTCVISQDCGMRTHGGWSRAQDRKSMKLFARKEYNELLNNFDYVFFPDVKDTTDGTVIDSYKRLVLRNNANDENYCFMRDELISSLAADTTLADTQNARPCAVFLNGEYYGFFWLHEVYDDNRLEDIYDGSQDSDWAVLKGNEYSKEEDEDDDLNVKAVAEYNAMYEKYAYGDLTDDALFEQFKNEVDIDNLLLYYAINIYIGNHDWPNNNYAVYKYYGNAVGDGALDGRWRWLLYDTEYSLGLYGEKAEQDVFKSVLGYANDEKDSALFQSVLKREDMLEKFLNIMCDLMYGEFSPESFRARQAELAAIRDNELYYALDHRKCADWFKTEYLPNYIREMLNYTDFRPMYIKKQINTYFGYEKAYNVKVNSNDNAIININDRQIEPGDLQYSANYYVGLNVYLSAQIAKGYEFDYWDVGGQKIYDAEISVSDVTEITLVTKPSAGENPLITFVNSQGDDEYVVISNPYSNDLSLAGLYFTDDSSDLKKLQLPNVTLKQGEKFIIFMESYTADKNIECAGCATAGFNIKKGETLVLSNSSNVILSKVLLPSLANNSRYEYNLISGEWEEFLN